ncbi:hypothetical protein H6G81_21260 [Scytonema hofmannii FACHB-248]|uniref:Uncharacterized protein n=1 Tax=Scytonema hofmannii FACHB-248 TaxID=1842502 RepID=A0ABR8GV25_9CYAN|nr:MULTISPECIES: hypothetical protein [Nostocales]MBD2606985.1 hypothetical protein [Scytonema hofmannii FACHB-248]
MSALDTFLDAQSSKVGKIEKSEPAISKRKSPNQRKYEDVRSLLHSQSRYRQNPKTQPS